MASEGAQLIASGLSTEVVEAILQSRAPSTRKLYALKWRLFTSWCGDHQLDPVNCPVGTVLEFLQARLSGRVNPLHLEGLCGGDFGLPRLSWWTVSGQTTPGYTFPPRCTETKAPSTVSYSSLGTWLWYWKLFVGLPSSLLRRSLIAILL